MRLKIRKRSTGPKMPASTGGKIAGTLFLSLFFFMGLFFAVLMVREFLADLATRSWKITPCQVVSSEVTVNEGSDDPFSCHILYTYDYKGQEYTSSKVYRKKTKAYEYYDKTARALDEFLAG